MVGTNEIIGGGFRLLRERAPAVAIWAAVYALISIAATLILIPQMTRMQLLDQEALRAGAMPDFGAFVGTSFLFGIFAWFVATVLLCASFRAVLRPEEQEFASIRIGGDELRVFGLSILVAIGMIFATVVAALLVMLVAMVLGFVLGQAAWISVLLVVVLVIAGLCALVMLSIRLTLMYPLTFIRHELVVDEAWALTRGHFWSLFAAFLIVGVISMILSNIVAAPMILHQFGEMMRAIGDPEALKDLQANQLRYQLEMPLALRLGIAVLSGVAHAISLALWGGSLATAARLLLAERGESAGEPMPD